MIKKKSGYTYKRIISKGLFISLFYISGCAPQKPVDHTPLSLIQYPEPLETQIGLPTPRPALSDITHENSRPASIKYKAKKHTILKEGGPLSLPKKETEIKPSKNTTIEEKIETSLPHLPPAPLPISTVSSELSCPTETNKKAQELANSIKSIGDVLVWSKKFEGCIKSYKEPVLTSITEQIAKGWNSEEIRLLNADAHFSEFIIRVLSNSVDKGPLASILSTIKTEGCGKITPEICQKIQSSIDNRLNF
jgi:hypothetical protein